MFKQQETLTKEITDLRADVKELVAAMNRGKGAFGFAMVLASAMGAVAAKGITYFFTHGVN